MEYDEVIAAFFQPSPAGVEPAPTQQASPARRLRDALEPIAMHSVWSRQNNERLAELGHDFMSAYACSRAGLMGEPEPGVVAAAFAVFEPSMIAGVYETGRALCDRDTLLATRTEATTASLTAALDGADMAQVEKVGGALKQAVDGVSGVGKPLFSGLQNQPWPTDPVGQLWRATEQFREHRGDSHVAVCTAAGLDPVEMNVLTELWLGIPLGEYSGTRGWDEATLAAATDRLRGKGWVEGDVISAAGKSYRDGLETQTDQLQQPIMDALTGQVDLDDAVSSLAAWSQQCIDAKAFPPNAFKRAAG